MGDGEWGRIAGLRVVMAWSEAGHAALPPPRPRSLRARIAGVAGVVLIAGGVAAVGVAVAAQVHAPQPAQGAAGTTGLLARGPSLRRSPPVAISIPAIGVRSGLLHLGVNPDGTLQVPSLLTSPDEAAWYEGSATPGEIGASVIEGHVDGNGGPAVFFRLGALLPGDRIDVRLADGITAVFRVTGVRRYLKSEFPSKIIYGATGHAALRLITCGGSFNYATRHYLSSVVVFASLASAGRSGGRPDVG